MQTWTYAKLMKKTDAGEATVNAIANDRYGVTADVTIHRARGDVRENIQITGYPQAD
jgi:hypothetical protein